MCALTCMNGYSLLPGAEHSVCQAAEYYPTRPVASISTVASHAKSSGYSSSRRIALMNAIYGWRDSHLDSLTVAGCGTTHSREARSRVAVRRRGLPRG